MSCANKRGFIIKGGPWEISEKSETYKSEIFKLKKVRPFNVRFWKFMALVSGLTNLDFQIDVRKFFQNFWFMSEISSFF